MTLMLIGGATAAFKPNNVFGGGFEFCSAQVIKKVDIGEVYIFWLFTDLKTQEKFLRDTYNALKFKSSVKK